MSRPPSGRQGIGCAAHHRMGRAGHRTFGRPGPAGNGPRAAPPTFGRPSWRETVAAECRAVRDRAGLVDLSAFSKFEIFGADAPACMERLGANRPPRAVGRIGITHALTAAGGVASEFTVTRLAADRYYLTSAAAAERHDEDLLRRHAASFADVRMVNRTAHLGVLGLMGPEAPTVLGALTDADLGHEAFPWLSARTLRIGTVEAGTARAGAVEARALRVSYAGECGWELHVAMADLPALHEALCTAGASRGPPALRRLRAELAPSGEGLSRLGRRPHHRAHPARSRARPPRARRGREFTGREALLARAESPSAWRMALLAIEPDGDADPFYTHTVWRDGRAIGIVTSAAPGHRTGTTLALAYLRPEAGSGERRVLADAGRPARMDGHGGHAGVGRECRRRSAGDFHPRTPAPRPGARRTALRPGQYEVARRRLKSPIAPTRHRRNQAPVMDPGAARPDGRAAPGDPASRNQRPVAG